MLDNRKLKIAGLAVVGALALYFILRATL